jgi:hypothetical protein
MTPIRMQGYTEPGHRLFQMDLREKDSVAMTPLHRNLANRRGYISIALALFALSPRRLRLDRE